MTVPMFLQSMVITLLVLWAALFTAFRLLPVGSRRLLARFTRTLMKPASPAWLRGLAARMEPANRSGGHCGDGCSSCGGCATAAVSAAVLPLDVVVAQPLRFRERVKS
jgi:hypothetical protein